MTRQPKSSPPTQKNILFVDDEAFRLEPLFWRIKAYVDCNLTVIDEADQAAHALQKNRYDVIVLDVMMKPGKLSPAQGAIYTGITLAKIARSSKKNKKSKIYFYTSFEGDSLSLYEEEGLVDGIVRKPEFDDLLSRISTGKAIQRKIRNARSKETLYIVSAIASILGLLIAIYAFK